MNLIIILIVGALVGWLAGMIMRSGGGILFDVIVGIVGALMLGIPRTELERFAGGLE